MSAEERPKNPLDAALRTEANRPLWKSLWGLVLVLVLAGAGIYAVAFLQKRAELDAAHFTPRPSPPIARPADPTNYRLRFGFSVGNAGADGGCGSVRSVYFSRLEVTSDTGWKTEYDLGTNQVRDSAPLTAILSVPRDVRTLSFVIPGMQASCETHVGHAHSDGVSIRWTGSLPLQDVDAAKTFVIDHASVNQSNNGSFKARIEISAEEL